MQGVSEQPEGNKKKKQSSSQATTDYKPKGSFCSGEHQTFKCSKWLQAGIPKRLDMVKETHLCANCLREGHKTDSCTRFVPSGIDGCAEMHNRKLHPSTAISRQTSRWPLQSGARMALWSGDNASL